MPAPTPSKDDVLKAFRTLDKRQKHLVYYRVLLRRYAQNKTIAYNRRSAYDFFMYYVLSLESLFLRSKKIHYLARALARALDRYLARDLDLDRYLVRDLALARDLAHARALDLARDLAHALDLFYTEIKYIRGCGTEESEANLLYVDDIDVERMKGGPFLRFLYDSSVDEGYVERFYEGFQDIDSKTLEQQDVQALDAWMAAYLDDALDSVEMARVILLGNGGAGKTSLVRKIIDPSAKISTQKETPRIEISHYTHESIAVDFWDFGGQVMMHSTHTFFLSPEASYIIVCNARADEQPDSWIEMLRHSLQPKEKINLFIVYTHVDSEDEKKNFSKYRKHALARKYGKYFKLSYATHSSTQLDTVAFTALKEQLFRQIEAQGSQKSYASLVEAYKKKRDTPTITYRALLESKGDFAGDDALYVKQFMVYGLVFPMVQKRVYGDDDVFVWQKHWLTYGVYELINSTLTRKNNGFLTKSDFKTILFGGKKRYIRKDGSLASRDSKQTIETIAYDKGIETLYTIVHNYGWAIESQGVGGGLIFPHAVKLDEPEYRVLTPYVEGLKDEDIVLEVLLGYVPMGFFFDFVTLADKHIKNPELLWRSGVILFDQMDDETFAYVQMQAQSMHLEIRGKNRAFLMHFLLYYIAMLFREDRSSLVTTKMMKRIFVDAKPMMVDVDLMEQLGDDALKEKLLKSIYKDRMIMANTYNINGGVHGSNLGDNGTVYNYNITVEKITEAKQLLKEIDTPEAKALIIEADALIEEHVDNPTWREKVRAFGSKALEYGKNISTADKAIGTLVKSGEGLMELGQMIMQ